VAYACPARKYDPAATGLVRSHMNSSRTAWIERSSQLHPTPKRLFCYHFAGGTASAFFSWNKIFQNAGIDLCRIQLPGRERRFREPPIVSMGELIPALCTAIEEYLDRPFSFFGHSMGSLICFEVARELRRRGQRMPDWLFLSSALPPHRRKLEMLHTLPLEEFVKTVAERYNAVPSEAMKNHEALNLFGHILQSDFQLLELHHYSPECPLPTMFAVFGGRSDPSTPRAELAECVAASESGPLPADLIERIDASVAHASG